MTTRDKIETNRIERPPKSNEQQLSSLSREINAPDFVASLLLKRGITEKEQARSFFLAEPDGDVRPEDLLGFEKTVSLLLNILRDGDRIIVHGDYDVDGIAGTAILYKGLKECGFNVDWFIPNRFKDGYGITLENIRKFHENGTRWIISVDTGISAMQEIRAAVDLGMKVIITDHHHVPDDLPPAEVILNPNQPGCNYSNKDLCGAGIAYHLINALMTRVLNKNAEQYLDLVALASLADSVTLLDENRYLVRKGLRLLEQTRNPGLRALLHKMELENGSLSSGDVLFKIIPLLNAPGRLGSPDLSFKIITVDNQHEASQLAEKLWEINSRRKLLDREATLEAIEIIEKDEDLKSSPCLVLNSSRWHEGIIGIVAAKLVDLYCRPAFVLSITNGKAKGSGRTVEGFNLHNALLHNQELMEKWGGHYYACGFSIKEKNINAFRKNMCELAEKQLQDRKKSTSIVPDVEINLDEINEETMLWLKRFEPFGPSNESPLFYTEEAYMYGEPRIVGGDHMKFYVTNGLAEFDAIAFGMGGLLNDFKKDQKITMAFFPEWNYFRNNKTIQLRVVAME
jgi:single-stranded-DNA-specific exonuclease